MTGASDFDDRFVTLRGGVVVPAPAYVLLLELEGRKFTITADGNAGLYVRPASALTAEDCARIRQWKQDLLMLVSYCQRTDLDDHLFTD
jgi:hypothetical protein